VEMQIIWQKFKIFLKKLSKIQLNTDIPLKEIMHEWKKFNKEIEQKISRGLISLMYNIYMSEIPRWNPPKLSIYT
jgi:hypothetical protein